MNCGKFCSSKSIAGFISNGAGIVFGDGINSFVVNLAKFIFWIGGRKRETGRGIIITGQFCNLGEQCPVINDFRNAVHDVT